MVPLRRAVLALVLAAGCAPVGAVGSTSQAVTYPNDQPAYDYFVGQGLAAFQAAGIVGNLDVESGVDPTAVESGGPGRGIAQWSAGGRWDTTQNDNAVWYAGTLGEDVETLDPQLAFIWYELTTFPAYGLTDLRASTDVGDATMAFMSSFEACGSCDAGQRITDAENVLTAFGSEPVDLAAPDGGGAACATSTGETGDCIDTAACAAMPGHVSTPGLCPGPTSIQCCTGPASSTPRRRGGCDVSGEGGRGGSLALVVIALLLARRRRTHALR